MLFDYRHPDGRVIEESFPIGQAPKTITVDGVECERFYGNQVPLMRTLQPFERGDKPVRSRQFPTWYGFRQRDAAWAHFLNSNGLENTQENRHLCIKGGVGPTPRQIERASKAAAEKAGALHRFDKQGNLMAGSKADIQKNLDLVKKTEPEQAEVAWD